ncbi:MAG: tetratricopeptide repeat protein [Acidobacteriota bacterium]
MRLAEVEIELGRVAGAVGRLEGLIAGGGDRNVRAQAALARGLLAASAPPEADRRRAAELLESALLAQPKAPSLRYQLATLYRELGEPAKADRHLALVEPNAKPVALRMSDPVGRELEDMDVSYLGHLGRGRTAAAAKRHLQAIRHFERARLADPDRFAGHFAATKSLLALGRDREARAIAEDLVSRFPDRSEAFLILGRLYRRDADPRSLETFERAVELDPQSLPAHRQLAAELRVRGQLDEAVATLQRARAIAPSAHQAAIDLADILVKQGDVAAAESVLREALQTAKEPWAVELALEGLDR